MFCSPRSRRPAMWVVGVGLVVVLASGCTAGSPVSSTTGEPSPASTSVLNEVLALETPRAVHQATLLADGRVLFTGGCSTSECGGVEQAAVSELFDPATGRIKAGPTLAVPRLSHTATLLNDGRVLVVGGYSGEGEPPTASIEVFDPTTDAFTTLGSLQNARADQTASLLPDGRVLVAGGRGVGGSALRSVEIIDPEAADVVPGPELSKPRTAHVATTFAGRVLLIGGTAEQPRSRFDAAVGPSDSAVDCRSDLGHSPRQTHRGESAGRWRAGDRWLRIGGEQGRVRQYRVAAQRRRRIPAWSDAAGRPLQVDQRRSGRARRSRRGCWWRNGRDHRHSAEQCEADRVTVARPGKGISDPDATVRRDRPGRRWIRR